MNPNRSLYCSATMRYGKAHDRNTLQKNFPGKNEILRTKRAESVEGFQNLHKYFFVTGEIRLLVGLFNYIQLFEIP